MKIGRRAALAALPISAIICLSVGMKRTNAQAGAYQYWEGTNASGAVAKEDSAVKLLKERVTLNIPKFGSSAFGENAPTATVEYTFVNPTEKAETVALYFPFELVRNIGYGGDWNAAENIEIRADGEKLEYAVRQTVLPSMGQRPNLDALSDVNRIADGAREDGFYSPELETTHYIYRVSAETDEEYASAMLLLKSKTPIRVVRGEGVVSSFLKNGYQALSFTLDHGQKDIEFWTVGGEAELLRAVSKQRDLTVEAELTEKTETTFGEFVRSSRPKDSKVWDERVSDTDWYNAVVDYLNESDNDDGICMPVPTLVYSPAVRWYEYELTVPAGGRVVNTVSAPLYAASSSCGNRFVYQFNPRVALAEGAELRIDVQTPYRMTDSTLEFSKTETGYTFSRDGLPYGALAFYVTDSDDAFDYGHGGRNADPLAVALILLGVLAAGAVAVAVVIGVRQKRRRQATEEAIRRQEMTRPVEGSVDLPEKKTDEK